MYMKNFAGKANQTFLVISRISLSFSTGFTQLYFTTDRLSNRATFCCKPSPHTRFLNMVPTSPRYEGTLRMPTQVNAADGHLLGRKT
jgi:hypothetical protein